MKRYMHIFLLLLLFSDCKSQSKFIETSKCNFFDRLSFKNGIDTLILRGQYMSMGELDISDPLIQLQKEKKLLAKDFNYAIIFQPENCEDRFYLASKDKGKEAMSLFALQTTKTIYLTCIFFEAYKYQNKGKPFFIVEKIGFENPEDK